MEDTVTKIFLSLGAGTQRSCPKQKALTIYKDWRIEENEMESI
jgi:hypothetical protein